MSKNYNKVKCNKMRYACNKNKKKMYLMGSSVYSVWPRKGSVNLKIGQQKSPKLKFQENKELKKKKNRIEYPGTVNLNQMV